MQINSLVDAMIGELKNDDYFNDISIWRAFPNRIKETRLSKINIAVSLGSVESSPNQIDGDSLSGDVSVVFNIFAPLSIDDRLINEIISKICHRFNYKNLVGIATNQIKVDRNLQAYEQELSITFRDEINFGGNENE